MKRLFSVSLLLLTIGQAAVAQPDAILLSADSFNHETYVINLAGRASIWESQVGDETIPDSAEVFTGSQKGKYVPGHCWNFHFSVENTSANDTLRAYLVSDWGSRLRVKYRGKNGEKTLRSGYYLNLADRAIPNYPWALPLVLTPMDSARVLFSVDNSYDAATASVGLSIVSGSFLEKEYARRAQQQRPQFTFMAFLLSMLSIMGLLAFLQFVFNRDRAYLFYALYVFSVGIYYLCNFGTLDNGPVLPNLVASYHHLLESFFNLLNILFYVLFLYHFLRKDLAGTGSKFGCGKVAWCWQAWPC